MTPEEILRRLRKLDSCVLSDAQDTLGVTGVADGLRPIWEGAALAGRVLTMEMAVEPFPGSTPVKVHLGARAIEAAAAGDVIVVANAGRTQMGGWGGLLTLAAMARGISGVIVDGACRDVDEARSLAFPIFAVGPATRTARGRAGEVAYGGPVEIAGISVASGDYVVADGTGVVFLPCDRAAEIVETAERLAATEQAMAEQLTTGSRVTDVLNQRYELMLEGGHQ